MTSVHSDSVSPLSAGGGAWAPSGRAGLGAGAGGGTGDAPGGVSGAAGFLPRPDGSRRMGLLIMLLYPVQPTKGRHVNEENSIIPTGDGRWAVRGRFPRNGVDDDSSCGRLPRRPSAQIANRRSPIVR